MQGNRILVIRYHTNQLIFVCSCIITVQCACEIRNLIILHMDRVADFRPLCSCEISIHGKCVCTKRIIDHQSIVFAVAPLCNLFIQSFTNGILLFHIINFLYCCFSGNNTANRICRIWLGQPGHQT